MAERGKNLKIALVVAAATVLILAATIAALVKYANAILKSQLERRLGKSFSVERIDLAWGHVEIVGMKLKNEAGKEVVKVGDIVVAADFMGLLRRSYIISDVTIKDPYLFVEIDRKGQIASPVLPPELKPGGSTGKGKAEEPSPPVFVKRVEITNGSIDYLDEKTPVTPVLTRIRALNMVVKDLSLPPEDQASDYTLSATVPEKGGTGTIRSKGIIKIKKKDMDLKVNVAGLDITAFKPYFQKESPADISRGFLDLDMDVKVASGRLNAPGTLKLKDLRFQSGQGATGRFMGVPLSLVVALLQKGNGEIALKFVMEGDLKNPKFNLRESLMNTISVAMADKLGLPLKGITEAVTGVGAKGAKEVGSSVKGIEKGLRRLFK